MIVSGLALFSDDDQLFFFMTHLEPNASITLSPLESVSNFVIQVAFSASNNLIMKRQRFKYNLIMKKTNYLVEFDNLLR